MCIIKEYGCLKLNYLSIAQNMNTNETYFLSLQKNVFYH